MFEFKEITTEGERFIREVASFLTKTGEFGNQSMLKGSNGVLPYSNQTEAQVWTANVTNQLVSGNPVIENNSQMADYLITLYNTYAEVYGVDANVIAAQSYKESTYKIWNYVRNGSTASGVSQFLMNTMYDVLYNPSKRWLTDDERDRITNGMTNPSRASSWRNAERDSFTNSANIETQKINRPILHQNIIDNPDLSIKLQTHLMQYAGDRNANLAASALFAYNTGSERQSTNYVELVNKTAKNAGQRRANDGSLYVEKIFGYLGDKNNEFITGLDRNTKGFSFGFDDTLKLGQTFDEFEANSLSGFKSFTSKDENTMDDSLKNAYLGAKQEFEAANDLRIGLTSVHRSPQRQKELYNVGRTPTGALIPGARTLTPLNGTPKSQGGTGLSDHNYWKSRAFDFGIFRPDGTYIVSDRGTPGRPLYEQFFNLVNARLPNTIWGGNFRSLDDAVHIALS